jgi:hypothetical protein
LHPNLMQTLDAAAWPNENQITGMEVGLVLNAEKWLYENGWDLHHIRGWTHVDRAFDADPEGGALVIRERRRGFWDARGERHPVRSVQAGLNILVNEEILPARFSTFGHQALVDHAEACTRAAARLEEEENGKPYSLASAQDRSLMFAKTSGLRAAAEIAKSHDLSKVLS